MKHIDKVFKEKLYNQKSPVPDDMWDRIAPALEDNSGRSILWFWFGGILALLLAGLGYVLFANADSNNDASTPLALATDKTDAIDSKYTHEEIAPIVNAKSITTTTKEDVLENTEIISIPVKKPTTHKTPKSISSQTKETDTKGNIQSTKTHTVVSVENTNTDNLYGKPANLVITKSYISEKGSFIEQSNTTSENTAATPSYNVFINSEGLNAGALLRVVEPLENIPLPAFTKSLKKKIIL